MFCFGGFWFFAIVVFVFTFICLFGVLFWGFGVVVFLVCVYFAIVLFVWFFNPAALAATRCPAVWEATTLGAFSVKYGKTMLFIPLFDEPQP